MTWVGIDDTDSPEGGCTTFVLTELLRVADETGVDLVGHPRLVRLNPNAPGKTRGNAALSARFGRGRGSGRTIGRINGAPVRSFPRGDPLPRSTQTRFLEAAWRTVVSSSAYPAPRTDPAMVATRRRLPATLYWEAVRRQLSPAAVASLLEKLGAWTRHLGSDAGLVGAAAAVSWPGGHPSWELIAYREPGRVGARRGPSARSLARLERRYPELFQCRDRRTGRVLVTPHTPCPILLGLRATSPTRLPAALGELDTEPVGRWVVFRSNQGTGDHLVDRAVPALAAYDSARLTGAVESPPRSMRGGHWGFRLLDRGGASAIDCIAFEPTKTLPPVVRRLVPGDRVRLWGSLGAGPPFRIEGIELLAARPRTSPGPLPKCAVCDSRLKSLGRLRGYRCSHCARRYPPEVRPWVRTGEPPEVGVYHPTPSARRHLAPRAPETPDGRGPGVQLLRGSRTDLYR